MIFLLCLELGTKSFYFIISFLYLFLLLLEATAYTTFLFNHSCHDSDQVPQSSHFPTTCPLLTPLTIHPQVKMSVIMMPTQTMDYQWLNPSIKKDTHELIKYMINPTPESCFKGLFSQVNSWDQLLCPSGSQQENRYILNKSRIELNEETIYKYKQGYTI